MNKAKAKEILGSAVQDDGGLYCCGTYISWSKEFGLTLDGEFELDYLEAIIWWIKNEKD